MGVYSRVIATMNNVKNCRINWDGIDRSKLRGDWMLNDAFDNRDIQDMEEYAHRLDDSKLYGYLVDDRIIALKELGKNLIPYGCLPRLYFGCDGVVFFLEFHPGTEKILIGTLKMDFPGDDPQDMECLKKLYEEIPTRPGWLIYELNVHKT